MADGYRPEVDGGTTSNIIYGSVVVNLYTKFGDPWTSSSFSAKIVFFFQNGVLLRLCYVCPTGSVRGERLRTDIGASTRKTDVKNNDKL